MKRRGNELGRREHRRQSLPKRQSKLNRSAAARPRAACAIGQPLRLACDRQSFTRLREWNSLCNSSRKPFAENYFGRLKGSAQSSRYGSCYQPRIACPNGTIEGASGQPDRIYIGSRIGSTGPGAIDRVNCGFRPTFPAAFETHAICSSQCKGDVAR